MLDRELGRDELRDAGIDLELRQVDGRHAELPRQHARDLGLLDEAELDEVVADARAVLLLLQQRAVELLARDEPLTHEEVTDPLSSRRYGNGHGCPVEDAT